MKLILFIDDDQFVTTLYKAKLQNEGFAVDVAHSANEAFEKLGQALPDVIVLDLNMPETNGVKILRSIRSVPQVQHIPVIIFSSGYIQALVVEATQLGIHKFFAKAQCPPKVLITEIKDLLSRPAIPISALVADVSALNEIPSADIPALLDLFAASEASDMQHAVLAKLYKASLRLIKEAVAADKNTIQGKLGRALEKLFEDLYTHAEHITASTKQTLTAALQKLIKIEADKNNPALESERALKGLLRTFEE